MRNEEALGVVVVGVGDCSDEEVLKQEWAYIMTINEVVHFMQVYGMQKVLSDVLKLANARVALKEVEMAGEAGN